MSEDTILYLIKHVLVTTVVLAAPILVLGLTVGLLVSIFQTITSIQEQSMTQIAKILTIMGALFFLTPLLLRYLVEFSMTVLGDLGRWVLN
ncbi:MAG: flagellar biosynthetic protein FliQ [Planctomycetota bacterium]